MLHFVFQWLLISVLESSVHRRIAKRLLAAAGDRKRSFLPPLAVGLGIWIGFPTAVAYQDMTSLISGL